MLAIGFWYSAVGLGMPKDRRHLEIQTAELVVVVDLMFCKN
jgi:hypothetical protein